ncbi:Uncharacterized protein FWK35_00004249 [Aphis craccivora]|uniref:Uncharacterized protein n=1 Tax=Aphis craccivora TaxID=307492 RepID=A0A6G0ZN75_APHCR|nr:Uncharacterized protein FWK35_00004249 [Aphis craccivora]
MSRFNVELFLNSERSDECIDFIMIITSRNNAPISNFGGGFRCKSKYPWCIIEADKSSSVRIINIILFKKLNFSMVILYQQLTSNNVD